MPFKFSGFEVGETIQAFDFQPRANHPTSYKIGKILEVCETPTVYASQGFAHYVIRCERDVFNGVDVDPKFHSSVGEIVHVPMETTFDYDDRIKLVPAAYAEIVRLMAKCNRLIDAVEGHCVRRSTAMDGLIRGDTELETGNL